MGTVYLRHFTNPLQAREALPGEPREFAISEGFLQANLGVVVASGLVWVPGFSSRGAACRLG